MLQLAIKHDSYFPACELVRNSRICATQVMLIVFVIAAEIFLKSTVDTVLRYWRTRHWSESACSGSKNNDKTTVHFE